jgi:integrase
MARQDRLSGGMFLLEDKYKEATRQAYRKAAIKFVEWMDDVGVEAVTFKDLDELMAEYVHLLYLAQPTASPTQGIYVRYGVTMLLPEVTAHGLPITDRALAGWRARKPSTPWPPLTWDITVLIACSLARHGRLHAAVAILLGFHCYLRGSEIVELRRQDVSLPGDRRLGSVGMDPNSGHLRLRQTKTGTEQAVQIFDSSVLHLLAVICKSKKPSDRVFAFSSASLRNWFQAACRRLGLQQCGYVLHSLRHGGATRDFLRGVPIGDILSRGRWESNKTSRRYIQSGKALLLAVTIPESTSTLAAKVALLPAYNVLTCARSS